jgi:protein kinase C substrate 80K-H
MKIGGYYIKSNRVYIISVFLAFKLSCAIKVDKLLGVPDEKLKFYKPQEGDVFKCLDGSKVIPYSAVNDDYCDCPDGSDEPGTSACPNTTFYCKNEGYIPSVIPSSRVNDGICDPECCDGSDENSGIIKCPNICEQIAYEQNKEEIEKKRILKDGLAKKEKLLSEASEIVKKENSKKDKLESEIEILNSKLKRLEEIQSIAEEVDQRVKAVKDKEINKKIIENCPNVLRDCNNGYDDLDSQLKLSSKKLDIYENGLNHISDLIEDVQNILNEDNSENRLADIIMSLKSIQEEIHSLHNEVEVAQPDDLVEDSDKSNDEDEDNSDDEADAKVENSHFKLDLSVNLDHLKQALELTPCEDGSRNVIFCIGSGIKSLVIGMKNNVVNDSKNLAGWEGWPRLRNPLNLTVKNIMNKIKNLKKSTVQNNNEVDSRDAEFGINFDELKNDYLGVKSLVKSTKNEYDKKEKELKKIKEKTDIDFGPQNVYRTFYNKCYDVEASGYIYTLCLFNDAKQKPKDGNSSTSLGKWSGFDSPTVMKFTNGEKCWNGPQRSAKVILKCSDKNELTSVTEPNKCEYEMIFYTPAACLKMDDDDNKSVKDEL